VARKHVSDSRILFPWESHGGVRRWIRFGHLRPVFALVVLLSSVVAIAARERSQAGVRQTRASLHDTRRAVESFMAEHDGVCPATVQDVAPYMKRKQVPRDAWGQLPRLMCPSRHSEIGYEVVSDGPDRIPGGLDRVE
jgi:hypothetical protein